MDSIVCLFRALASVPRLQMLRSLLNHPDVPLGNVVQALSCPMASRHMKLLAQTGLILTRPSGRYVFCRPARTDDPGSDFLKRVRGILARYLRGKSAPLLSAAVLGDSPPATWEAVLERMCFEFTAYAHLRRLLMLRLLCEEGRADAMGFVTRIGMSCPAALRHADKLVRRGVASAAQDGEPRCFSICRRPEPAFRRALLAVVRQQVAHP